ncbi:hypothetical protein BT93_C1681 [Corymbia citriodora subsp. variegata]|nr:hypothetical protein BT93_C1681 [Corymbia citriodora subsp. variegata]
MASADVAAGKKRKRADSSPTTRLPSENTHEVFLNFRGTDTRKGFTGLLYERLEIAGINVFKDDKSLGGGEEIDQGLKDAIKRSRISIAIFSKDYASSRSCLMELQQMWECSRLDEHTLIPVFWDVSPGDVTKQMGEFKTSFDKHVDGKVNAKTIHEWREVLRRVGNLSGYVLKDINGGDEAALLNQVFDRVMEVLYEDDQYVPDKVVGIDILVQEMMTKLGVVYGLGQATKVCGDDVRVVRIYGMPGVGKTTLAQVVFKKIYKSFNRHSFLEDINLKGVKDSQEQLIADLQKKKPNPRRPSRRVDKRMRSLCTNTKVLIVLDDVHEDEQIKKLIGDLSWFGPGSRIIVTTDRKDVSITTDRGDVSEVFGNVAFEDCKVEPMGINHANKLFWKHAVRGGARPDDPEYDSLSREIVEALGGLPLAIVIWAKYLNKKTEKEIWRDTRNCLRDNPHEGHKRGVEAAFRAKYDYLNHSIKETFLDIACFFVGKDERIPSYMWRACDSHPSMEIEELRDMHFLEDGENNELRMHRLLRDLGRKIVNEGKVLQERCRIWKFSDARSILEDGQLNESVRGISLPAEEAGTVRFTCEALGKKSNLRYLRLDGANIVGTSENLLPNLRWLDWRKCHFIPDLRRMDLKKLVILDLSWSPVTEYSRDWRQIMEKVKELKVLNLQGCDLLKALLESPASTGLEILIMEDCSCSLALGAFISELKLLKSLNLRNCKGVQQLIQRLLGKEYLTELLIDGTDIVEIHIEKYPLENLKVLSARDCKKLKDIARIDHLTKLESLALDGAINWHPETFEFPQNLRRLSLRNCPKFKELPPSIGNLGLLEVMDLSDTIIKELPESAKKLTNLKTLKMERTRLLKFPKDIAKLKKLEEIDFSGCKDLEAQDSCDISGLSSLRILKLSSSNVVGLPRGISNLSRLRTLDVGKCDRLKALPELPSSLVTLCWGSKIMEGPKLTNLTNLKELCLNADEQPEVGSSDQTPDIGWIMGLTSLETLELSIPSVTNLPGNFRAFTHLWELTLSYMEELDLTQLPSSSSLWTLRLKCCMIQEPNFSGLKSLSELELDDCNLATIDGLGDLRNLEVLKIFQNRRITDLNELKGLPRLRKVKVFPFDAASLSELRERGCEVDTSG